MDALLSRAKRLLPPEDYEIIKGMADTISFLSKQMGRKNAHIKKLMAMLFGATTEKTAKVLKEKKAKEKTKQKAKGHGRNAGCDYKGAEKIKVEHKDLKAGDKCPACKKGKLYGVSLPKVVVRVTGNPPLSAKVYEMARLRCNLCGKVFTATAPPEAGDDKYDSGAGAMVALLKYGSGLPFNRIEALQKSLGVPLASSTQWDIVEGVAAKIEPAYKELVKAAAQGDIIHNDDTVAKILDHMKLVKGKKDKKGRKGTFTTGIASVTEERKITLFYTGTSHAGENIAKLLLKRNKELGSPIQMCDALKRNVPKDFKIILSNCLAHARRRFVDIGDIFPAECKYVLETLKEVYKNDAYTKERAMSPEERLNYHKDKSSKLMKDLKTWLNLQLEEKKIEPNSSLGSAITYMLNHWKGLTLFLRVPKAPLDNNLCERLLKRAILHRKNALFYKSYYGAYVGDLFMSLIHTSSLCGANPFQYLKVLQDNSAAVSKDPKSWMPWNYQKIVAPEG
jgi:transposase